MQGRIPDNNILVRDFTAPLLIMDRSSRQKINAETLDFNYTLDHLDLTVFYRTFHQTMSEYTFFSSEHGTFPRIDHILDHKKSIVKFKKKIYF